MSISNDVGAFLENFSRNQFRPMKNSIKREQSQTGLNSAERENFRLKGKKQNVFIENLLMETQTVFTENGNINIYPCIFELGQHIVAGGMGEASQ